MNEVPDIPVPPPRIPRGPLWISLSLPPGLTLFGNLLGMLIGGRSHRVENWFILVMLLQCGIIFGLMFHFIDAIGVRFEGRSMVLLGWFYLVGQFFVCLFLWLLSIALFAFLDR